MPKGYLLPGVPGFCQNEPGTAGAAAAAVAGAAAGAAAATAAILATTCVVVKIKAVAAAAPAAAPAAAAAAAPAAAPAAPGTFWQNPGTLGHRYPYGTQSHAVGTWQSPGVLDFDQRGTYGQGYLVFAKI